MSNPIDEILNRPIDEGGTPVRWFKGKLKKVSVESATFGTRTTERLVWDFVDCEILESREPYPYPTVQFKITNSNRPNTSYEALKKSLERVLSGVISVDSLEGKMQEWKQAPAQLRLPVNNPDGTPVMGPDGRALWEIQTGSSWQLVSCEGYESSAEQSNSLRDLANLAHGKTEQEFYTAIMGDVKLKANQQLINSVIGRTLLPTMVNAGVLMTLPTGPNDMLTAMEVTV